MIVNEVELKDIDIYDLDTAENYENAIKKVSNELGNQKDKTRTEIIRCTCTSIFECFNSIFGDGTDKLIFGDKVNMMGAINAFEELIASIKELEEKGAEQIKRKSDKYKQQNNQQQHKNINPRYRNNRKRRR